MLVLSFERDDVTLVRGVSPKSRLNEAPSGSLIHINERTIKISI